MHAKFTPIPMPVLHVNEQQQHHLENGEAEERVEDTSILLWETDS